MNEFELKHKIARYIAEQKFSKEGINEATNNIYNLFKPLIIGGVVSSCVDKDELISDLDDRRAVGVEMNEDMWYFCRKQSAEYLLDKYKILRK